MKICPQCNKTYNDDNLNFCLDDGSVLNQTSSGSATNDLPETVMINQPHSTPPTDFSSQPQKSSVNQPFGEQQTQPNWGTSPQPIQTVKKSSKSWVWVLGILGVLVVVCGGGFIGFIALLSNYDDNTNLNSNFATISNSGTTNSRTLSGDNSAPTPDDRKSSKKISLQYWVKGDNDLGKTEYKNGIFFMNAKKSGFYYVMAAKKNYKTEDATTKLTLANTEQAETNLGFGLVFHSDPQPLQKDYAFVIDTVKQRFRIVRHDPKRELTVISWTDSDAIKSGSQENVLEVRDADSQMEFYINGVKVATKPNAFGYRGGVAGLYTGVDSPIAFSDFEIKN